MSAYENALELSNVSKHYTGFDLKDINLALPKGTILGLVGENGAGKTTTIKMIMNAISRDMMDLLTDAVLRFRDTPELKVMLIRSHGRYFSSGADLRSGNQRIVSPVYNSSSARGIRENHRLNLNIVHLDLAGGHKGGVAGLLDLLGNLIQGPIPGNLRPFLGTCCPVERLGQAGLVVPQLIDR